MINIRTILLPCFLLFGIQLGWAQVDDADILYGSFKLRKNANMTCVPDSLLEQVKVNTDNGAVSSKTGVLKGTVSVNNSSHRVIPGAFITVSQEGGEPHYTLSDEQGKYVVNGLQAGSYRVDICRLGYKATTLHYVRVEAGKNTFADIQMPGTYQERTEPDDFPMDSIGTFKIRQRKSQSTIAPGSIQGTVALINNEFPLEKVVIELYQNGEKIGKTNCDENGKFSILKLPNGMYEVKVITDRNNNDMIPGVQVNTGKIRIIDVRITRKGRIKGSRRD